MNTLEHALAYARMGWPIFRLTGYKTPFKGSHGFKDATVDEDVIRAWWGQGRVPNIGLATGTTLVVDADGTGLAELLALAGGRLPRTLTSRTSNGWHFYFRCPVGLELRSSNAPRKAKGDPGIDLKGAGGYVVLPPSRNAKNGFVYQWANWGCPIAELPEWLLRYWRADRKKGPAPYAMSAPAGTLDLGLGYTPAHLQSRAQRANGALSAMIAGELPAFLSALRTIDAACGYDDWFRLGAAIHDFEGGALGLAIFKRWSARAEGYREESDQAACEAKWREYARPKAPGAVLVTKSTVYARALEVKGGDAYDPQHKTKPPTLVSGASGDAGGTNANVASAPRHVNGHVSLPVVFGAPPPADIHFPDTDKNGEPRATTTNAGLAIRGLGVVCRKDVFHEKMLVGGQAIDQWAGDLSDDAVVMLRKVIKHAYGFDPGEKNARDAAVQRCLEHQFNPVVDYLDGLTWDGASRVGTWVAAYLGAEDTTLNREFGRLMLVAAVRRARKPGTKFDQIIVLEGREGTNKSTALKVLAGDDNFSDQNILAVSDREQQEAVSGVWVYEISDLAGMRRAEIERVKQFASRTEDRARPAYGRLRLDKKRQCIFCGTTNRETYLLSETGNRRFWCISTAAIDIEGLRRDRDQLWAEAAVLETRGESIELHPKFWGEAGKAQDDRRESEPWAELVERYLDKKTDVSVMEILQVGMQFEPVQISQVAQNRVARVLRDLKWERYKKRIGERLIWHYRQKA